MTVLQRFVLFGYKIKRKIRLCFSTKFRVFSVALIESPRYGGLQDRLTTLDRNAIITIRLVHST